MIQIPTRPCSWGFMCGENNTQSFNSGNTKCKLQGRKWMAPTTWGGHRELNLEGFKTGCLENCRLNAFLKVTGLYDGFSKVYVDLVSQ